MRVQIDDAAHLVSMIDDRSGATTTMCGRSIPNDQGRTPDPGAAECAPCAEELARRTVKFTDEAAR